jgi:putative ABC transport system permease protein
MFKSYCKIAWRNISRSPFYSSINIVGLATGIAFTLLIASDVWNELQVNRHLKDSSRQYIIQSKWGNPNEGYEISTLGPLAKALKENYPTLVIDYYRFDGITSNVSMGDKSFREDIAIGDSSLLSMYGFRLMYGNAVTALNEPFTVVITAVKALKYFGNTDVLGKALTIDNFSGGRHEFTITGIMDKTQRNSVTWLNDDNNNQVYVSAANLSFFGRNMDWNNPHIAGYLELGKGVTAKDLEKPIAYLVKQHAPQFIGAMTPYLVPLQHYYLDANNGLVRKMLYALCAIAFFILAMAVINFTNMSVSLAGGRMREIGVRKVLGSLKRQLVLQFLVESVMIVCFATLCSFIIYALSRNVFSDILGRPLPPLYGFPTYFIAIPVLFILVTGILAGLYPAYILSSLKSVESLKGKFVSTSKGVLFRKLLIAFQFGTAMIAFTGAIIISKQVDLFFSHDLGFNKDYIVSAQLPRDWSIEGVKKKEQIKRQFSAMPEVAGVSLSFEVPDGNNGGQSPLYRSGRDSLQSIATQVLVTDESYLDVYKVPLRSGTFFEGHGLDSATVILNETAAMALGYGSASAARGGQLRIPGDATIYTIKGVTADFHFGSMQQRIPPIVFFNVSFSPQYRFFSFKLHPGNAAATLNALQKKWASLMPGAPFEYTFMDDTLARLYKAEIQIKKASCTATLLALIIVLLGVLGLISMSVQKRTREIGIRKVLGSSVPAIIALFIKEFLVIIIFSALVACPLVYLIMHQWLQAYAYRISLTASPFVAALISLGLITALLICLQTIKAATENPVKSLRTE